MIDLSEGRGGMVLDIVGNTLGGLLAVLLAHAMLTGIVPVG